MLLYYTSDTTHILLCTQLYIIYIYMPLPCYLHLQELYFLNVLVFFFICVCTFVYVHASQAHAGAQGDKKSTLDSLDLQIVTSYLMWVWKTKLR